MKNSKLRKALMLVACAVLLVCLSVGATLAYLTSATEVVQNTFSVGDVKITLDEADVDDSTADKDRDTANAYHLMPGGTYTKDPTVWVDSDSEDCYLRMIVKVEGYEYLKTAFPQVEGSKYWNGDIFNLHEVVNGWKDETWKFKSASNGTYEFWYTKIAKAGESSALFTEIKIPDDMTNTQIAALENVKINVVAHAIQAEGFAADITKYVEDEAAEAWVAFGLQNP